MNFSSVTPASKPEELTRELLILETGTVDKDAPIITVIDSMTPIGALDEKTVSLEMSEASVRDKLDSLYVDESVRASSKAMPRSRNIGTIGHVGGSSSLAMAAASALIQSSVISSMAAGVERMKDKAAQTQSLIEAEKGKTRFDHEMIARIKAALNFNDKRRYKRIMRALHTTDFGPIMVVEVRYIGQVKPCLRQEGKNCYLSGHQALWHMKRSGDKRSQSSTRGMAGLPEDQRVGWTWRTSDFEVAMANFFFLLASQVPNLADNSEELNAEQVNEVIEISVNIICSALNGIK